MNVHLPTKGGWINSAHPQGQESGNTYLSNARNTGVAQERHRVPTLFLCHCEAQTTLSMWEDP